MFYLKKTILFLYNTKCIISCQDEVEIHFAICEIYEGEFGSIEGDCCCDKKSE